MVLEDAMSEMLPPRDEPEATAMTLTSRGTAREVPWYDHAEFLKVADPIVECGEELCNSIITHAGTDWTLPDGDQRIFVRLEEALRRIVSIWMQRPQSLPLAVESTAALLLPVLNHHRQVGELESSSVEDESSSHFPRNIHSERQRLGFILQLSSAMAIVRMVNGVTGAEQKGKAAMSVSGLADRMLLPRICVDIRHEATHNAMPSHSLLRLGISAAFHWLLHNYWIPEVLAVRNARIQLERAFLHQDHSAPESSFKRVVDLASSCGAKAVTPVLEGAMSARSPFSEPDILKRMNVTEKRTITYGGKLVKKIILENRMLQESVLEIVSRLSRQRAQEWFVALQSTMIPSASSSPGFAKALARCLFEETNDEIKRMITKPIRRYLSSKVKERFKTLMSFSCPSSWRKSSRRKRYRREDGLSENYRSTTPTKALSTLQEQWLRSQEPARQFGLWKRQPKFPKVMLGGIVDTEPSSHG